MGQYFHPVNLDKDKKHLVAHDFDNGLKLMEHSYLGNNLMNAVERLLMPGGEWHKDRIVWAGDYADGEPDTITDENKEGITIYSMLEDWNKLKPSDVNTDDVPAEFRYICNHTKKQFVDKQSVKPMTQEWAETEGEPWKVHPLSLLTCEGNGRGGGDYRGDNPLVGTWARDSISIESEKPEGYEELDGTFVED